MWPPLWPDIRVGGDKARLGQHHLNGMEWARPEVETGIEHHGTTTLWALEKAGISIRRVVRTAGQISGHSWCVAVCPQTVTEPREHGDDGILSPAGLQGRWEDKVLCRTLQEPSWP